jgi:predicted RNA-binding Zn-ribbon protein involved in translation (DUF1610 family)
MARPRQRPKTAPAKRKTGAATATTRKFECPECGRKFGRAAALGAHRNRAHGVPGTSNSSSSARARRTSTGRGRAASASRDGNRIDRDALLRALFPQGIPPRQDVVRAVNAWLDDAEQLARIR